MVTATPATTAVITSFADRIANALLHSPWSKNHIAALMAQKNWPDNAVISGRRTASYAAGSGANPHKFQAFAPNP
jgi:hypothetical protein